MDKLLLSNKKYIVDLQAAIFSIINKSDPNRTAKKLHLKNWCRAFLSLFIKVDEEKNPFLRERIPFFLDILSDEECWEETDTIHRVNLNRTIAAKKIVQSHSRSGIPNPLDYHQRYQIACCCCLEEDIFALFEHFKQNSGIRTDDEDELNKLVVDKFSEDHRSEPLTVYWSHLAGGYYASEMPLDFVFGTYVPYVEAVEFFCNKIRSLPENVLSDKEKDEIIIKSAVRAAEYPAREYPEVFEYCHRKLSLNMYPEFIKRECTKNLNSLGLLQENICFDQFQKLFDCLDPKYISKSEYYSALNCLIIPEYSENYASEALKLFTHMWMKEGFDEHRSSVLDSEMRCGGELLVSLVKKNYMKLVWALLDKTSLSETKMFMNSSKANYIVSELYQRGDKYSLKKFLSYATKESENPSLLGVGLNSESENDMASAFRQGESYLHSLEKFILHNHTTRLVENQSNSRMEVAGNSKKENCVASEILQRHDQYSLNDISSCNYATRDSENQSISAMEVDADWSIPLPKRQRIE